MDQQSSPSSTPPPKAPSNSIHTVIVMALILAGAGLIYRAVSLKMSKSSKPANLSSCVRGIETFQMQDSYIRGIIAKGESFDVQMNYFECNPPQAGDLVLYKESETADPVVKIVRAVGGDDFELIPNKDMRRWEIKVNGQFLTYRERNYYFGRIDSPNAMKKYHEEHDGALQDNDVVLFSLIPPGIQDSGTFGPVKRSELIGKVTPTSGPQTASNH